MAVGHKEDFSPMPLNKKLLNQVKKHIQEEPRRLVMSTWFKEYLAEGSILNPRGWGEYNQKAPACGTVGCIAGWTCALAKDSPSLDGYAAHAAELLGFGREYINNSPSLPFNLFYVDQWPLQFRDAYYNCEHIEDPDIAQKQRVKIVCEVIDFFKSEWDRKQKENRKKYVRVKK